MKIATTKADALDNNVTEIFKYVSRTIEFILDLRETCNNLIKGTLNNLLNMLNAKFY